MLTLQYIFFYALILVIPGFFAFILIFYPHKIVQWQGNEYRKFYKRLNMSDDDIDRTPQLPSDRALMGKKSYFINEAPENPEKFTGLIVIYRLFGVVVLATLILVLMGVIFIYILGTTNLL